MSGPCQETAVLATTLFLLNRIEFEGLPSTLIPYLCLEMRTELEQDIVIKSPLALEISVPSFYCVSMRQDRARLVEHPLGPPALTSPNVLELDTSTDASLSILPTSAGKESHTHTGECASSCYRDGRSHALCCVLAAPSSLDLGLVLFVVQGEL